MQMLAILGSFSAKMAWAALCSGALLLIGFICLALVMIPVGSSLHSSISFRWLSSVGTNVSETCGTRMEKVCFAIVASSASATVNSNSTPVSCSWLTMSFLLNSTVKPPLCSLLIPSTVVLLIALNFMISAGFSVPALNTSPIVTVYVNKLQLNEKRPSRNCMTNLW